MLILLLALLSGLPLRADTPPEPDERTYRALALTEARVAVARELEAYHRALGAQLLRSREPDELALGWLLAEDSAAMRGELLSRLLPRARNDRLTLVIAWATCRADPALRVCRGWSPVERLLDVDGDNLATLLLAFAEHNDQVLARLRVMTDAPLYADAFHLALRRGSRARAALQPSTAVQAACLAVAETWQRWAELDPRVEPLATELPPCQRLLSHDEDRLSRAAAQLTPDYNPLLRVCAHTAGEDRAAACRLLGRRIGNDAQSAADQDLGLQLLARHGMPGPDLALAAAIRDGRERWQALLEAMPEKPEQRDALIRRARVLMLRAQMTELQTRQRLLVEFSSPVSEDPAAAEAPGSHRPNPELEVRALGEEAPAQPLSLGLPVATGIPVVRPEVTEPEAPAVAEDRDGDTEAAEAAVEADPQPHDAQSSDPDLDGRNEADASDKVDAPAEHSDAFAGVAGHRRARSQARAQSAQRTKRMSRARPLPTLRPVTVPASSRRNSSVATGNVLL